MSTNETERTTPQCSSFYNFRYKSEMAYGKRDKWSVMMKENIVTEAASSKQ